MHVPSRVGVTSFLTRRASPPEVALVLREVVVEGNEPAGGSIRVRPDPSRTLRTAIAFGAGSVWTFTVAYALFGPTRVYGSRSIGVLPWVGIPLVATLVALGLYARRNLGRRNAWVTGGFLVGVTLVLSFPALSVLPRYDGDKLWALYPWFGVGPMVAMVEFSTGVAREARRIVSTWPQGAVPPRPDGNDHAG
jgi:hypothetical protein